MHVDRRGKVTRLGRVRTASTGAHDGSVPGQKMRSLIDAVAFRMLGDPDLLDSEERARVLEILTGRATVIDGEDRDLLKRAMELILRHMAAEVAE